MYQSPSFFLRRIAAIFHHSLCKYGIVGKIELSHTLHPQMIANNRQLACELELSSSFQASRRSAPEADYDSAIDVHICINGVPGRARYFRYFAGITIFVARGGAPFGQHQESRPLGRYNFLSMRKVKVSYSYPIRFVRLDSEHAPSDGKSVNGDVCREV